MGLASNGEDSKDGLRAFQQIHHRFQDQRRLIRRRFVTSVTNFEFELRNLQVPAIERWNPPRGEPNFDLSRSFSS